MQCIVNTREDNVRILLERHSEEDTNGSRIHSQHLQSPRQDVQYVVLGPNEKGVSEWWAKICHESCRNILLTCDKPTASALAKNPAS